MRRLSPSRLAFGGVLLLAIVAVLLWLLPSNTYIFLPDRARPVDPLITVQGGHKQTGSAGIYFVDIFVRKATLLERLWPSVHEAKTYEALTAGGAQWLRAVDAHARIQRNGEVFEVSQVNPNT